MMRQLRLMWMASQRIAPWARGLWGLLVLGWPHVGAAEKWCADPPTIESGWVESLLRADPQQRFASLLRDPAAHRVQVLVTEVVPKKEEPCLRSHGYRLGAEYYYPASAIKIVGAVAALLWLQQQQQVHPTLTVDTPLTIPAARARAGNGIDVLVSPDTPAQTLRQVLRETLVVSSNPGFNWLYDVAGPDWLHQPFWRAGLSSLRVRHRLADRGFPRVAQRFAPPIRLAKNAASGLLSPLRQRTVVLPSNDAPGQQIGTAHFGGSNGPTVVTGPLDFSDRNAISLRDLQAVLIDIVRPDLSGKRLPLTAAHRELLRGLLAEIAPRHSARNAPPSDRVPYKPFATGFQHGITHPESLHVESKAGRAYGFLVDNAYFKNERTGREIFVVAVIYANQNGVVGDDQYEYETIGLPFFEALGEQLAAHWASLP